MRSDSRAVRREGPEENKDKCSHLPTPACLLRPLPAISSLPPASRHPCPHNLGPVPRPTRDSVNLFPFAGQDVQSRPSGAVWLKAGPGI